MTEVMQRYELILGLKPDLSADKQKKILEKVKNLIADAGGKAEEVKSGGLTKLAYPIAGFSEASFTTIFFTFEQSEKASERSERSIEQSEKASERSERSIEQSEKASERSERSIPGDEPKAHQPLAEKIKSLQKELKQIKDILRMMVIREEVKR